MERPAPRSPSRRSRRRSRLRSRSVRTLLVPALLVGLGACTYPRASQARPVSVGFDRPLETELGRAAASDPRADEGPSAVFGLGSGLEALAARIELIDRAEGAIDLQTYILHADVTGRLVLQALLRAADRGVRVRVLVDDINVDGALERDLAGLAVHPGIETRIFHAFPRGPVPLLARGWDMAFRYHRQNSRMHNKLLVVDGAVAITGGRNIGDEYFDANSSTNFNDLDVMLIGEVVPELAGGFDEYWNSDHTTPLEAFVHLDHGPDALERTRAELAAHWEAHVDGDYADQVRGSRTVDGLLAGELTMTRAEVHAVVDPIEKAHGRGLDEGRRLYDQLVERLGRPREELLVVSPYFVPGREGVDVLVELAGEGARVAVLTNSLAANDVPLVHTGYARHRRRLLEGGVELYEMRRQRTADARTESRGVFGSSHASLHAKALLVDGDRLFVGSMNLDPRSIRRNTEVGVVVVSERVGEEARERFAGVAEGPSCWRLGLDADGDLTWTGEVEGEVRVLDEEPGLDPLTGTELWFLGLLPIESQL